MGQAQPVRQKPLCAGSAAAAAVAEELLYIKQAAHQRSSARVLPHRLLINHIDMPLIGARVAARELMGKQDVMLSFPAVP